MSQVLTVGHMFLEYPMEYFQKLSSNHSDDLETTIY